MKRLSQSHLDSPRAIQVLCLLQTRLLHLNTCLDLGIMFDIGLIAKKRQPPCFYPLPSCSDQFAWRLLIALRLQLKRSKQLFALHFPFHTQVISTPALPPVNIHSTAARETKITIENSHAIYPPNGKKGRQRETFMRREDESARRAPQRVRHTSGMARDKEERRCFPAWSLPSSTPTSSPLHQIVQRHKPLRIYCMFLPKLHFHI